MSKIIFQLERKSGVQGSIIEHGPDNYELIATKIGEDMLLKCGTRRHWPRERVAKIIEWYRQHDGDGDVNVSLDEF